MKRLILFVAVVMLGLAAKAQVPVSMGGMYGQQRSFRNFGHALDSNTLQKKWFVTKYASLSAGFVGFSGGSASFISAPVGVQLNRQLTNTLYAFAGLEIAPTYLHMNNAFMQPGIIGKNNAFMGGSNNLSINPAARVGLMYVNPDRTFSISGSIGVSRNSYNGYNGYPPVYGPAYNPAFKDSRF
ncbi:hypothetical protein [Paraflavitalea pollutisoli]|uniref:hypothetical protein n=1 Tax=Paraflavitalea pollutisoli TaxID=3034143 RepID=UPI0023EBE018|nr:hypothetical protein [Paraflavitalea sp. H1-2-19X]